MSDLETNNNPCHGTCHGWFPVPFWHHCDGNHVIHKQIHIQRFKKNIYVCNDPNFQEAMLVLRKYHTFNKLHVDLSRINMKQQFK